MSNTNENQEKKEGTYFIKQFVRGNTSNKGSIVQLSVSRKTGDMLITIAPQKGMNGNLPIFDYEKKMIFNLTEEEIIKTMSLFNTSKEGEISFPHLNGKNPKTIVFKNSFYNEKLQFQLYVKQGENGVGFFFNPVEARVLLKNLEDSISIYNKMNAVLALNNIE